MSRLVFESLFLAMTLQPAFHIKVTGIYLLGLKIQYVRVFFYVLRGERLRRLFERGDINKNWVLGGALIREWTFI